MTGTVAGVAVLPTGAVACVAVFTTRAAFVTTGAAEWVAVLTAGVPWMAVRVTGAAECVTVLTVRAAVPMPCVGAAAGGAALAGGADVVDAVLDVTSGTVWAACVAVRATGSAACSAVPPTAPIGSAAIAEPVQPDPMTETARNAPRSPPSLARARRGIAMRLSN
jgi:hypothetical protein